MSIGQAQLRTVETEATPVEVRDGITGETMRAFGGDVSQCDGPPRAWNAAGTPYATLRWEAGGPNADKRLLDAFEIYLTPILRDEDFWSIEWRARPTIEREYDRAQLRCRLIVHKRSKAFRDAGVIGVQEGYPSWSVPE